MMNRATHHCLPPALLIAFLTAFSLPSLGSASNEAVRWNAAVLQAIRNTAFSPVYAARAFSIVHTCMYDAWAAYDDVAVGTRAGGALRRPPRERTERIPAETFQSYLPTPPFPEYTSGHSAFSAAAAEVLRRVTGSDTFQGAYTVRAGSSFVEPGVAPHLNVTLAWTTFEEAANEAGVSRQYGLIHFKDADIASRVMGRKIGTLVWEKSLRYFNGTAPAPQSTTKTAAVDRNLPTPVK